MWHVYVIINKKETFKYIGICKDLNKRLHQHNKGYTQSTKPYIPFTDIIKLKSCKNSKEARKWEKYYKSGIGRDKVKNIIESGRSSDG
jgi:putative endonuclease